MADQLTESAWSDDEKVLLGKSGPVITWPEQESRLGLGPLGTGLCA